MVRLVSGHGVGLGEQIDQYYPRHEPSHVRPERHTPARLAPTRQQAAEHLNPDPVEEHRPRGQRHRGEQLAQGHHHEHAHMGVEDQIGESTRKLGR
jgi:hypothetical protein